VALVEQVAPGRPRFVLAAKRGGHRGATRHLLPTKHSAAHQQWALQERQIQPQVRRVLVWVTDQAALALKLTLWLEAVAHPASSS
jgi:hypothetical protein